MGPGGDGAGALRGERGCPGARHTPGPGSGDAGGLVVRGLGGTDSASPGRGVLAGRARGRSRSSGAERRGTGRRGTEGLGVRSGGAEPARSCRAGPEGVGGVRGGVLEARVGPGTRKGAVWEVPGKAGLGDCGAGKSGGSCDKLKFVFIGA